MEYGIWVTLLFGVSVFIIYWIPSFVGSGKKNSTSITLINLFFGWTLIGWLGALIWALTTTPVGKTYNCPTCGLGTELPKGVTLLVCSNCGGRFPVE